MTHLVLYDSQFGNTEKVAQAIGKGIGGDVQVKVAKDIGTLNWSELTLLVVGSPTQGGRPTVALQKIFDSIPADALQHTKVAAFDTRFAYKKQNFALKLLMKTIAFAAEKIAKTLQAKSGMLVAKPEAFFVSSKEGPLLPGELERAEQLGRTLTQ